MWPAHRSPVFSSPLDFDAPLNMASTEQQSIRSEPASDTGEDGGEWRPGLDPHDQARLTQAKSDPFAIVEEIPTEKSSLGWFSVSCLIFNRMIGE